MNSKNYHILWLDDESQTDEIEEVYELFPNVSIEYIPFIDKCDEELENHPEKYDAVIFDANNQKSAMPGTPETASKIGLQDLVENTLKKKIPVYIYSGELNPHDSGADILLDWLSKRGLRKKENIFEKGVTIQELFEKILSDFNSGKNLYVGFEYLRTIFKNNWIDLKYKTEDLDPIMRIYKNHDVDSAHGNQMRKLVEQMLEKINSVLGITDQNTDRTSAIIHKLKHSYSRYAKNMIGALTHMDEMPNEESHNALDHEMRELHFQSDFATFFLVANWFYNTMTRLTNEGYVQENQAQLVPKSTEGKATHSITAIPEKPKQENQRDGVYEKTYEENGRTFVDLKVEVKYDKSIKDRKGEAYITGIRTFDKRTWQTFPINMVREASDAPKPSGFSLAELLKPANKRK